MEEEERDGGQYQEKRERALTEPNQDGDECRQQEEDREVDQRADDGADEELP